MPASHHSLFLTPLRVLACLALLSVVAAGIAITVILSQSTNPMFSIRREVIVPDLSGMDWQQAQVEQSAAQLSIVWDTRYSAQAEGIVIAQKPTAGSTVKQGQKLILSVSKGPNTITVPDLKSQNRPMPSRPCGTPVLPFPSIISATIPPCRPIPLFCNLLPPAPHWKPGTVLPLPLPVPYQTRSARCRPCWACRSPKRAAALPLWSCCPF